MFGASVKDFKANFFDQAKVKRAVDASIRKPLSKAGAFVYTTARGLIKKGKKPSKPGEPPHGHGQQLLKKFIFFAYDDRTRSVVIGPAKLNGTRGVDVPLTLELGGTTQTVRTRKGRVIRKQARIAARPYMGPSLAKNQEKFPSLFANSVQP